MMNMSVEAEAAWILPPHQNDTVPCFAILLEPLVKCEGKIPH
jgi:hypothetical protein